MKTILSLLVACLFIFSNNINAQSQFYLQLSTGYAIEGVNDDLGSPFPEIGNIDFALKEDGTLLAQSVYGNLGAGFKAGLGIGYMFTSNIGFEAQLNYTKSGDIMLASYDSPSYSASHKLNSYRLSGTPQIVLKAGQGKMIPFAKFGANMPITGESYSFVDIRDEEGRLAPRIFGDSEPPFPLDLIKTVSKIEAKSTARFTVGVRSTLGVMYELGDHVSITAELIYEALSLPINYSEITKFETVIELSGVVLDIPGTNYDELDVIDLETVYAQSLDQTANNPAYNENVDVTKALESLEFKNNYNNLGVYLGLMYEF